MKSYKVVINGKEYAVAIEETTNGSAQDVTESVIPHTVTEPKTESKQPRRTSAGKEIKSPMPGSVLAVKVQNGKRVLAGDILIVLEAMKMENEIVAPCSGTVAVYVKAGDKIEAGDIIAGIDEEEK